MALRRDTVLHADMQRVIETLHRERTSVEPYADQYRELLDNHGKMIRASLVLAFAHARARGNASAPAPDRLDDLVITGAAAIEMLHLATLVHDDVLDGAPVRRNQPTVQTIVGNKTAIYLGDLILTRYMEIMASIAPNLAFVREQSSTLREIVAGELMQESSRHDTTVSVDHYMQAIGGKTAALFRLACLTGLRLSGDEAPADAWITAATNFGDHLGTAFQIVDDLQDFDLSKDTGKPKLEDIADGIYTLPVLLALREDPAMADILNDPQAVVTYFADHPQAMRESRSIASYHVHEAAEALDTVPMHEPIRTLLDTMLRRFDASI